MKILYGVQGTGNGHIARARGMCQALSKYPVEVDYLFSGRAPDKYFSMDCFGEYEVKKGLTFISEGGGINYLKTALKNNVYTLFQDIRRLDLSSYDLILNDFEPVTAWAAKLQNRTCISLSHQNAFRYSVPSKGAGWLDKKILTSFAPASHYLGLHWYHFDQPILPPIVNHSGYKNENKGFILVYLPFECVSEIYDLLSRFTNHQFICFHPDINEYEKQGNITFFSPSHNLFQEYLHACAGVIANGGFELPSEAMALGKKLLLKPLGGQFEQQSNVATLDMLGLASSMGSLDPVVVRRWLDEKVGEKVFYPNVAEAIAEWVIAGNWDNYLDLCRSLWKQVDFPSYASIN
ncbi:MJ1255/VC2487 family glycosyltransferase [Vibrio salinus]|uniref:MJ1255/VC2487 family glycosyltransferase n=1 Tax=Vibrio salinus TaxID=2899784 RepID=UPI001E36A2DE|nr:MJ1255/VC2487 family glycosyltransferase [Vibrio salinus]MCE0494089.1 glycosyltransferase [Vibrio salinus]